MTIKMAWDLMLIRSQCLAHLHIKDRKKVAEMIVDHQVIQAVFLRLVKNLEK